MNPLAELRYFFTALGYFTRVPVPRWVGYEPHYLNAAARYFPLVGVLVGGLSALVYLAALRVFPAGVAVLLSMAVSLARDRRVSRRRSGGLLSMRSVAPIRAKTCCASCMIRASVRSAPSRWSVALALKWQTLAALPPLRAAGLMIAAHAASRTCAISYLATLDYVRAEGKAKPVAQRLSGAAFACAALFGLPWLLWPNWLVAGLALRWCGAYDVGSTALCTGPLFRQTHWRLYRRLPWLRAADFRIEHLSGGACMDIVLIRHPAVARRAGVCYGHSDVALADDADVSVDGARDASRHFAGAAPRVLMSSPLMRCATLAAEMANDFGCAHSHDERLKEMDFGDWERSAGMRSIARCSTNGRPISNTRVRMAARASRSSSRGCVRGSMRLR